MSKGWKIAGIVTASVVAAAVTGTAIWFTKALKDLDNLTWPEDLTYEERKTIANKSTK